MEILPILVHRIKSVLALSLKTVDLAASTKFGVSHWRLKRIWLRFGSCFLATSIEEVMLMSKVSKRLRCFLYGLFVFQSLDVKVYYTSSYILIQQSLQSQKKPIIIHIHITLHQRCDHCNAVLVAPHRWLLKSWSSLESSVYRLFKDAKYTRLAHALSYAPSALWTLATASFNHASLSSSFQLPSPVHRHPRCQRVWGWSKPMPPRSKGCPATPQSQLSLQPRSFSLSSVVPGVSIQR